MGRGRGGRENADLGVTLAATGTLWALPAAHFLASFSVTDRPEL